MRHAIRVLLVIALTSPALLAAPPAKAPAVAADAIMGEYEGKLVLDGKEHTGLAQVIAEGDGKYRAVLMTGLWQPAKKDKQVRIELTGQASGTKVALKGTAGTQAWTGALVGGKTLSAASEDGKGAFAGTFRVRTSPTLEAKPPKGAIVLLPYKPGTPPPLTEWTNKTWKPLDTGAMEVGKRNTFSTRKFGSIKLHIEFRCPFEPKKRGQGRGNSGTYLQQRYEVQVLDSFGLKSGMGDCGAIYGVAITGTNASLPPLAWQTYDIEFHAAKLDADGKVVRKPTMTVRHNGILTHEKQELPGHTRAAAARGFTQADALMLQDHGNKVQYRNVWVVELKE